LLNEWMLFARQNKLIHDAARQHYSCLSNAGLITAVILGSAGGLVNILLGTVTASSGAVINVSQVALGFVSILSAAIVSIVKQLGWEQLSHTHTEYAAHYGELDRLIGAERTIARISDSAFASVGDLIKRVQEELDRFEEGAPTIPAFIENRLGKCRLSPATDV
jgi:hypothetical protein